jgi:pyridoxal phosphate enzyme (YggS family)
MSGSALATALARVRDDIARVQAGAGLRHEVRIVAVTKGHPAQAVREALAAGLHDVGENRVQEALAKQAELGGGDARWHLVGHLQTNKARLVPGAFALVHSVDSARVAEALAQAVRRAGTPALRVLLQVNLAAEAQKSGCTPDEAGGLLEQLLREPALEVRGLMTMAPFTDDETVQRRVFAGLRQLRDRLDPGGGRLRELSMGMSGDYRAAVAEGATMLRLGTVLFGERAT